MRSRYAFTIEKSPFIMFYFFGCAAGKFSLEERMLRDGFPFGEDCGGTCE